MPGVWPTSKKIFSSKMKRSKPCTNKFFDNFGEQRLVKWENKPKEDRDKRLEWLAGMDKTQLPLGPYPLYFKNNGWVTFSFDDKDWHACFSVKKDFNLGLQFVKSPLGHSGIDGRGIKSPCERIEARLMQEYFDPENNCFAAGKEWTTKLSGKYKLLFALMFAC